MHTCTHMHTQATYILLRLGCLKATKHGCLINTPAMFKLLAKMPELAKKDGFWQGVYLVFDTVLKEWKRAGKGVRQKGLGARKPEHDKHYKTGTSKFYQTYRNSWQNLKWVCRIYIYVQNMFVCLCERDTHISQSVSQSHTRTHMYTHTTHTQYVGIMFEEDTFSVWKKIFHFNENTKFWFHQTNMWYVCPSMHSHTRSAYLICNHIVYHKPTTNM